MIKKIRTSKLLSNASGTFWLAVVRFGVPDRAATAISTTAHTAAGDAGMKDSDCNITTDKAKNKRER